MKRLEGPGRAAIQSLNLLNGVFPVCAFSRLIRIRDLISETDPDLSYEIARNYLIWIASNQKKCWKANRTVGPPLSLGGDPPPTLLGTV